MWFSSRGGCGRRRSRCISIGVIGRRRTGTLSIAISIITITSTITPKISTKIPKRHNLNSSLRFLPKTSTSAAQQAYVLGSIGMSGNKNLSRFETEIQSSEATPPR